MYLICILVAGVSLAVGYMISPSRRTKKLGGITLNGDTKIVSIRKYVAESDPYRVSFREQRSMPKPKSSPASSSASSAVFVFNFNTMDYPNKFLELDSFIGYINANAKSSDTVIIRIKSPGGTSYMFEEAYAKLCRLKQRGINVIASVDSICASGGYMIACACKKITASQTASVGSIGVFSQACNFKDLADKIGIKFLKFASSDNKGGFPTGSEYTEEDIRNANDDIGKTMQMFSNIVKANRTVSDDVLTAKVWYAEEAKQLGLVDEICTYDELISNLVAAGSEIYICVSAEEQGLMDKFKKYL